MSSPHRRGPVFSMDTLGRSELLNDLEALQLQGEGIRKAIGFSTTIMKLPAPLHIPGGPTRPLRKPLMPTVSTHVMS